MSKINENVKGIENISDDEINGVTGGAFFQRCFQKGVFEANFPCKECKGCPKFSYEPSAVELDKYIMTCTFFSNRTKLKKDRWGLTT